MMPFLLLAAVCPAGGESLWSPDFKGYLSGSKGLAVGDSLVVQIDASSSLSFSSSSNDSKNLTLEFTGGESGNLFSFLPQVRTGGTQTTTGKDTLSLKTQIPVVVTAVNPDGTAQVQGSRTVAVQGKNESITVSGADLSRSPGPERLHQLLEARQRTAHLHDIPRILERRAQPRRPPEAAGPRSCGGGCPRRLRPGRPPRPRRPPLHPPARQQVLRAATAAPAAPAAQPGLTIPDARKKDAPAPYLNRLIDVVFSQ